MKTLVKRTLIGISIAFNLLFLLLLFFSLSRRTASLSFFNLDDGSARYTTGAFIISVPEKGADLVFGPAEFTLKPGEEAALQFSVFTQGRQLSIATEPLYDHAVVSVEQTGYGFIVRALQPGEAVVQFFTGSGIRDIALVTVVPFDE